MATSNRTPRNVIQLRPRRASSGQYADGVKLGAQMLAELEAFEYGRFDPFSIDAGQRPPATTQHNVVLQYLRLAREGGNEVVDGFTAVLTDFLGMACAGSIRESSRYKVAKARA